MCDFSEKGQKMLKRAKKSKIFENLGKNVLNLKIFLKRAGDYIAHNKLQEKALYTF